jgi:hypothetical protein
MPADRPAADLTVRVPVELLTAARRRLGSELTAPEAVRHALAHVAGADPAGYAPVRPGRPWVGRLDPEGRTGTLKLRVCVAVELLALARRQLNGGAELTDSEAVRHALAAAAGVHPDAYPVRPGRPWEGVPFAERRAHTEAARRAQAERRAAAAEGQGAA